jgi:hypothetical protein
MDIESKNCRPSTRSRLPLVAIKAWTWHERTDAVFQLCCMCDVKALRVTYPGEVDHDLCDGSRESETLLVCTGAGDAGGQRRNHRLILRVSADRDRKPMTQGVLRGTCFSQGSSRPGFAPARCLR